MTPLFRPQALAQQQQRWLGNVRLIRPLSLSLLTCAVVVAAVLLGTWLWTGHYTRKAQLSGVLVPDRGLIRLLPPVAGMLVERRVGEGQQVSEGAVLFVVELERTTLDRSAQAQVQRSLDERRRSLQQAGRAQSALSSAERDALEKRLRELQREREQLDAEVALQQQRLTLAQAALARLETLRGDQFVASSQVQAKAEEVLALRAAAQGLERQRATLARERATAEGELRGLPLRDSHRRGELERQLSSLVREAAEYGGERRVEVRAPHAGTVSAVAAEPGQAVTPAQALATLVPQGAQLQAHLFAPSGAIGFVQAQQEVRLRLLAYPHQKFGVVQGKVLQVSRTPLAAQELAGLTAAGPGEKAGEAMFRITVSLDEPQADALGGAPRWTQPLSAGMRLDADVLLERRRLVEWLFAPVLGLKQRQLG